MGAVNSTGTRLEKALAADLPESERYFGLENYGSTCYANSVLQCLYFCEPFRRAVLEYDRGRRVARNGAVASATASSVTGSSGSGAASSLRSTIRAYASDSSSSSAVTDHHAAVASSSLFSTAAGGGDDSTMLTVLADLFNQIASQKKRTGSVPPKAFINKLRQVNDQFSGYMHQDAQEFLLFLLNELVECLNHEASEKLRRGSKQHQSPTSESPQTFIHSLFEGQETSETRCLCCETVTQRIEPFFVVSVEIQQNSSLTACLRNYSSTELLEKQNKFDCAVCCSLQEAELRKRIKCAPQILALHLKRFKYNGKAKKLSYRVVFPLELRLYNTSDDAEDPDRLYSLFAVVVHVGSGPSQGHYVTLVRSFGQWLLFDDDCVEPKDESELQAVFGLTQDSATSTEAGFLLFYEKVS